MSNVTDLERESYEESVSFYRDKASRADKIIALIGDSTNDYIMRKPQFPQILVDIRDVCTGYLMDEKRIAKERIDEIRNKRN